MSVGYFNSLMFNPLEDLKYEALFDQFYLQLKRIDDPGCEKVNRIAVPLFTTMKTTEYIQRIYVRKFDAFKQKIDVYIHLHIEHWKEFIELSELKGVTSYNDKLIKIKRILIESLENVFRAFCFSETILPSEVNELIQSKTENFENCLNEAIVKYRNQCCANSEGKKGFDQTINSLKTQFPETDCDAFFLRYENLHKKYTGTEQERPTFVTFIEFAQLLHVSIDELKQQMQFDQAIKILDKMIKKIPEMKGKRSLILKELKSKIDCGCVISASEITTIIEAMITGSSIESTTVAELD